MTVKPHEKTDDNEPLSLLCVDDEVNVRLSLQRIFEADGYHVLLASDGKEALSVFEREEVAVLLTDLKMPGMDGLELLKHVKHRSPDTVRMILTARADLDSTIGAINDLEVFRFIVKPWSADLKVSVRQAFHHYKVCAENRELTELTMKQNQALKEWTEKLALEVKRQTQSITKKNEELERLYRQLEGNFVDTIKTFSALLDMRDAETCSHSRRVTQASRFIAKQLGITGEELRTIEIAAMLHDVGKIGIPDTILKKPPKMLSRMEKEILQRHPVLGQNCVHSITRLSDAGVLIRHHHEHFGGGGYPDRISGEAIPLGSRIIAAADAFDRCLHPQATSQELHPRDGLKLLRSQAGSLFDPKVVNALAPYADEKSKKASGSVEISIPIKELKEGMVLAKNIITAGGILLIARGETLSQVYVEKIKNYARIDPSMSTAYIYQKEETPDHGPEEKKPLLEVGKNG